MAQSSEVLDYTEIKAVPTPKTVAMVNAFILSTTTFLNRFAAMSEERLTNVSLLIQRLEISLALLEAKLASIPDDGLNTNVPGAPPPAPGTTTTTNTGPPGADVPPPPGPPPPSGIAPPPGPPPDEAPKMRNRDDPRYARFFKMLDYGVPLARVQQDMMIHGIDPSVIDRPDAASDAAVANDFDEDKQNDQDEGGEWDDEKGGEEDDYDD